MSRTTYSFPERVRPWLAPLLVLLLLTVVYGLVSLRVAAWVGGKVITRGELATRMRIIQFVYDRQFGEDPNYDAKFSKKYQREVLDQLAEEAVLLTAAAGLATEAETAEYAASAIGWIKTGYFQDDESQWQAELAATQITAEDLTRYFSDNLLLTRLHDQQVRDISVDEAAAKAYFEQNRASFNLPEMVKVSHIVVATRAEAEQVLQELQGGADFAALAKQKSLDQESASLGGSLRWFQRGETEAAFENTAFALSPGQLSGVIETGEGWHVLRMESRQLAAEREYAEVASLAASRALEAAKDQVWEQYRRTLRGKQLILLLAH